MNYEGLQRLREEQQRALAETAEQLTKWNKFKDDYLNLQDKIRDLPNEVSYDYMVPFGPMAFMPGKLIHTNEVMVLLGDNWFAEVSAKHSCEIISRRLANVESSIEKLNEQKRLLESRTDFTEQFSSNEVDITEEYNSDEDKKWRESHRQSVLKERLGSGGSACHSEEDVLDRLEALQLQETRQREMQTLHEDIENKELNEKSASNDETQKTVSWGGSDVSQLRLPLDMPPDDQKYSYSGDDSNLDSDDSDASPGGSVIRFKHSPRSDTNSTSPLPEDPEGVIRCPSDIYRLYRKPDTKSILKKERSFEIVKPTNSSAVQDSPTLKEGVRFQGHDWIQPTALQTRVVERASDTPIADAAHSQLSTPTPTSESGQHQSAPRVSKFKAMRQKRQNL